MFERTKQTRRSQSGSLRRKTVKAQRGGALWYSTIPPDRLNKWTPILEPLGLDLTMHGTMQQRGVEGAALEEYYTILEHQDELFQGAIKLIAADLQLPENYTSDDIIGQMDAIDGQKDTMMGYLEDVEQLVNFQLSVGTGTWGNFTKLQDIRTKTNADGSPAENLSDLLLYPKRATNLFIASIANFLILLKRDQGMLTPLTTPRLQELFAQQIETNVRINAQNLTHRSLRDGFYLGQSKGEIKNEISGYDPENNVFISRYFVKLIEELKTVLPLPATDIFKKNGALIDLRSADASWAFITAHVFLDYKHNNKNNKNILSFFNTQNPAYNDNVPPPDRTYTPEPEYDNESQRGVTYKQLRSWMDDKMLQFILHLSYTIRSREARVIAEQEEIEAAEAAATASPRRFR